MSDRSQWRDFRRLCARSQFLRFALVGVLGFLVDLLVLQVSIGIIGLGPVAGRLVSYLCAATTTWAVNRRVTFPEQRSDSALLHEWALFLMSNAAGGGVNLGFYWFLVTSNIPLFSSPVIALAVGSVAGLLFNFLASKHVVFSARSKRGL